jgi:hypothetical protein
MDIENLKIAVERQHGGTAMLAESVPVKETRAGAVVWEGVVHVRFERPSHSLYPVGWVEPAIPINCI